LVISKITFNSFENCKYAQYDKAIKVIFKPDNKRNLYYNHFYDGKKILIYKGWQELPETVLYDISIGNGIITKHSKYTSCDYNQFDDIIRYFENKNLLPIINTYNGIKED
jgi:hypothetical protein